MPLTATLDLGAEPPSRVQGAALDAVFTRALHLVNAAMLQQ